MIVLRSTYRELLYKFYKLEGQLYHKDAEVNRLKMHIAILEQSLFGSLNNDSTKIDIR